MTTKKSFNRIAAVVFALSLLVSGGAQAGTLLSLDGRPAIERGTFFDQAANWMLDAWAGLTSIFASDSDQSAPATQNCTSTSGCGSDGDAGPGIDPEG